MLFFLIRLKDSGGDIAWIFQQDSLFQNGLTLSVCAGKELMAGKQPGMRPSAYDNTQRICAESLKTSRHLLL